MAVRPHIVLFGDSITEQSFRPGGWGAAIADTYSRKADIVVRGYGGYNTRWALLMLHHIFPLDGQAPPPKATTIFFGANDAVLLGRTSEKQHVPIDEYKENLKKIIAHLKELSSEMVVVLVAPPPVDEDGREQYAKLLYGEKARKLPERTNEMTGTYASVCSDLAKEMLVCCVHTWSIMQETPGWQKLFLRDGLHLTEEGNAVVHREVVRVLYEAGLRAEEMQLDFPHHSQIDGLNPQKAFIKGCSVTVDANSFCSESIPNQFEVEFEEK